MGIGKKCNTTGTSPSLSEVLQEKLNRELGLSGINNVNSNIVPCQEQFIKPQYTMSGACCDVIGVTPLGCPDGYSLSLSGDTCLKTTTTGATLNGTVYTGYTGSVTSSYMANGTRFYASNLTGGLPYELTGTTTIYDVSGNTITEDYSNTTDALWNSLGSVLNGRLNNVGIWVTSGITSADTQNPPYGEWVGFSECVNIPTTGTYSLGFAGDNQSRVYVDGTLFFTSEDIGLGNSSDLSVWKVFEYDFYAGEHVIEMQGRNDLLPASNASIGLEIYSGSVNTLTGITTTSGLSNVTIFTTADLRTDVTGELSLFELGESNGYSCPAGYYLDTCSFTGGTAYTCTLLETTGTTGTRIKPSGCVHYVKSGDKVNLQFNISSATTQWTGYTGEFCYRVITSRSSLVSDTCVPFSTISGDTIPVNIDIGVTQANDAEYTVKTWNTYVSKCVTTPEPIVIDTSQYGSFTTRRDDLCYLALITDPPKPLLGSNVIDDIYSEVSFVNEPIQLEYGSTNIAKLGSIPVSPEALISLNGITLRQSTDYNITEQGLITFTEDLEVGDSIQAAYYKRIRSFGVSFDFSEQTKFDIHSVDEIPNDISGTTGTTLVTYNTTKNRYEFFTSRPMSKINQPIITLNGVTLALNKDVFISSINESKLNFTSNINIEIGDIITVVYIAAGATSDGYLGLQREDSISIPWTIQGNLGNPSQVVAEFTVEITSANDKLFENISKSKVVDWQPTGSNYSVDFDSLDTTIRDYIYRIRFNKKYYSRFIEETTESGPYVYTTESVSDTGSFGLDVDYIINSKD